MNRLWKATLAVGLFAAVSLGDSIRFGRSSWPSVALFCLAGLLACIAACIDAAAESAKHEAELDSKAEDERLAALEAKVADAHDRVSDVRGLALLNAATVDKLATTVDHLQKKDALNALG